MANPPLDEAGNCIVSDVFKQDVTDLFNSSMERHECPKVCVEYIMREIVEIARISYGNGCWDDPKLNFREWLVNEMLTAVVVCNCCGKKIHSDEEKK